MKTWMPIVVVAVLGAWLHAPAHAGDASESGWHSAGALAKTADTAVVIKTSDDGRPAAAADNPPNNGWHRLGARQPASSSDTAATQTVPSPPDIRRLPADPGYRASGGRAALGAAVGQGEQGRIPGRTPDTGESEYFLPPDVAPEDRSPCDYCGDCRCRGGCAMARHVRCDACSGEDDVAEAEKPYRLFDWPSLSCRGIEIRGWLDQGFTYNPSEPLNRFNGPVTFNDRSNEYQLNQLYLIGERVTDTAENDWDIGGRVDALYGTDSRFVVANGLETTWNRGERFYGLAMPQVYGDIAFRKWTFRFGHFYAIHGNEVALAPDNFFYSHSYSCQYGEPFTHTGMLGKLQLTDELSLTAGMVEGWDQWVSINKKLGFLGGVNWASPDKRTAVAWAVCLSNEQEPGIESTRSLSTLVLSQKLGEGWKYVFQNDYGYETNLAGGGGHARWYSFDNYLLYELNERWSFGLRYEWFVDEDGTRVAGLGTPKGIPLAATPARWQEASLGLNYKYNANVLLRSELRWDWATPIGSASWVNGDTGTPGAHGPFDDFSQRHQALWAGDWIVKF